MSLALFTEYALGENQEHKIEQDTIAANIQTLESYKRIRDGVKPSLNESEKQALLWRYQLSFEKSRHFNDFQNPPSPECKQFTNLYSEVGKQSVQLHERLISEKDMPLDVSQNIEARLSTLKLFETALFSLVLKNSEGGYSELDSQTTHMCVVNDRLAWENAVLRAHRDLQNLHEAMFGFPSPAKFESEVDIMDKANSNGERDEFAEGVGVFAAEFVGSIYLWSKLISPVWNKIDRKFKQKPTPRRSLKFLTSAAFSAAFVEVNDLAQNCIQILHPTISLSASSMSGWANLMSAGNKIVSLKLMTPAIHFEYLKLIAALDKQAAYDFVIQHQAVLSQAESQYGSIDMALEHLKQEQKNENNETTAN